jgi:hypothetical protein
MYVSKVSILFASTPGGPQTILMCYSHLYKICLKVCRPKQLTDRCMILNLKFALRTQTKTHIRDGRSHYIDTYKPIVGHGADNEISGH